jgi:AraC-like DNA-binding protein
MMKGEINPKMYMYKRIVEAKLYIDRHYNEKIDLNNISNQASFSKYHFLRLFKGAFGKSPHQYLIEIRISSAKKLLKENNSVKDVCFKVGFESVPSFISLFKKRENITPNEYLKKNKKSKKEQAETPLAFIPNCFVENYGWNK